MRRYSAGLFLASVLVVGVPLAVDSQQAQLTILNSGPTGEINQLQDANEIRVIFSEPMVPLGRVPSNPTPPWIRITPAIPGAFRWSGTTILIFSPDPARPLPYATRYTVRIDANATSAAGRQLGKAEEFTFTTPTVKLTSARWYRRGERFDTPLLILLQFNQRVRPQDVLAHLAVTYEPHDVDLPEFSPAERARIAASDPDGAPGVRRQDRAARVRRPGGPIASSVRLTSDWDKKRFPESDRLVVVETTRPDDAWRLARRDDRRAHAVGRRTPSTRRTRSTRTSCSIRCSSSMAWTAVRPAIRPGSTRSTSRRRSTSPDFAARAGRARSQRSGARACGGARVARSSPPGSTRGAGFRWKTPASIVNRRRRRGRSGSIRRFKPLTARRSATRGSASSRTGTSARSRASATATACGRPSGGPLLPFYARNFRDVTQWLTPLDADRSDAAHRRARRGALPRRCRPAPARRGGSTSRPIASSRTASISRAALGPRGTGLVWAAVEEGEPIAQSRVDGRSRRRRRRSCRSRTSASPSRTARRTRWSSSRGSTTARRCAGAHVSIVDSTTAALERHDRRATASPWRRRCRCASRTTGTSSSFVVTAEKDGDVAYVGSDWNEGHRAVGLRHRRFSCGKRRDILRGIGVHRSRRLQARRRSARQGDPSRRHARLAFACCPTGRRSTSRVRDSRDKVVDRRTVTVNGWSSAEWTWTRAGRKARSATTRSRRGCPARKGPKATTSRERVPRRRAGSKTVHGSFLVAAYRRPDFRVDVTLDARHAGRRRAAARHASTARYLFGSADGQAAGELDVHAHSRTTRRPRRSPRTSPTSRYVFGYYRRRRAPRGRARRRRRGGADAERQDRVDAAVDARRRLRLPLHARRRRRGRLAPAHRQPREPHRASGAVVHRRCGGPTYFVDSRRRARASTSSRSIWTAHAGAGRAGDGHADADPVELSVRRAEGNGFYTWDTERKEVAGRRVDDDDRRPRRCTLAIPLPEGGYFVLARDGAGRRRARARGRDTSFYALGDGYTAWAALRPQPHRRSCPRRRRTSPATRRAIMIQSPWEQATALVTTEREGVRTLPSVRADLDAAVDRRADHRGRHSERVRLGAARQGPHVEAIRGAETASDPGKPSFRLGYARAEASRTRTKRLTVDGHGRQGRVPAGEHGARSRST